MFRARASHAGSRPVRWAHASRIIRASSSSGPSTSTAGAGTSSAGDSRRRSTTGTTPAQDPQVVLRQLGELQKLAEEAARLAIQSGPQGLRRGAQAAQAFVSVAQSQLAKLSSTNRTDRPEVILRMLFERLGATYIKLGQFIASSPTLFPEEYVLEFQKCLDETPPIDFSVIRGIVEKELGMALEDVFETVDPKPLATASIAQVHAAVLRGSGKEVVIKVLKPGVEDTLTTDLNFLYIASRALEILSPDVSRASLADIVGDIRTSMLQEVDFRKEAEHVRHFAQYLDSTGLRGVATCPDLYTQYCSQKVMVMERLDGAPLIDLDAIRRTAKGDPEVVLVNALNVWLGSLLGAETFHADVHAGNLLILPDGRVGFIDFGIVGKISQTTWRAVEALLRSTATGDYDTMARALVTIGATKDKEVDIGKFASDLRVLGESLGQIDTELVVSVENGTAAGSIAADNDAVNRLLLEIIRVGEENGVKFPREFALLIKQVLYFDRYTRLLAPGLDFVRDDRVNLGAGDIIDV